MDLTKSISLDFTATNNARIDEPFGRIDTKEKKDTVRKNVFKGGRNTQYAQQATLTYNVPMQKIPLLDWTTLRASYSAQYNWLAASILIGQENWAIHYPIHRQEQSMAN